MSVSSVSSAQLADCGIEEPLTLLIYVTTIINMKIEFDPAKNAKNIAERGLSFSLAADLDWATSITYEDARKRYPESRFITLAFLDNRLHVICYALIEGGIRVISFRKANKREQKAYESQTADR
jgi:uncharacterized protein